MKISIRYAGDGFVLRTRNGNTDFVKRERLMAIEENALELGFEIARKHKSDSQKITITIEDKNKEVK